MRELLFFVASSFWAGAAHAATPGHGKTIAAAYIVGARGKPIDAVILGIFVTLSHTSGIVLVGVLTSLGSSWLRPQRIEAYLALAVGALVIVLGLWMLWTQRDLLALGIAGGLLPDPAALALLLAALSSGKVLLGLTTVLVFSLGFAATLVVVGIVAAKVGEKVQTWLSSIWMVRVQILTSLLIVGMGVVLTIRAV